MTREEAEQLLKSFNPTIIRIDGYFERNGEHMFLAPTSDPDEGHFLPFYKVLDSDGSVSDFDPTENDDSGFIIQQLTANL